MPCEHSLKCIKTLKTHSVYFQEHPLTAHFHRLKRRFSPFSKQNKACFSKFCIILLTFGRNFAYIFLSSLASFRLPLQSTSQNITKKKSRKNGQKNPLTWFGMAQNGSKWGQNDAKMTPNDAKAIPKRLQSDPKTTPDRPKNGPKSPPTGPNMTPKTAIYGPK